MGSQVLHRRDAAACVGSPTGDLACSGQPTSPQGCQAFLQSQDFIKVSPKAVRSLNQSSPAVPACSGDVQDSCHLSFGGAVTRVRKWPTVLSRDPPCL